MKLNLACGKCKLEGYLNTDIDPSVEPDQIVDVCAFLPWEDNQFEEILFFHAIEHIQKQFHQTIFSEIRRVLKEEGRFVLGYPEFEKCIKYWLDNYLGKRDFWEACIFGRQLNKWDHHVCAMNSVEVQDMLLSVGFKNIKWKEERDNPQYTVLTAVKGVPRSTYEQHIGEVVFGI